jgi:hypothetical protein
VRIYSRLALVVIASGVVLALAVGAMAVPARLLDKAGSGDPGPITLRPLAQRSYMYAADGSILAVLREEEPFEPTSSREASRRVARRSPSS